MSFEFSVGPRTALMLILAPMATGCTTVKCDPDQAYMGARPATWLEVPSELDGYEARNSMTIPGGPGDGNPVLARESGSCLAEPPPLVETMERRVAELGPDAAARSESAGPSIPVLAGGSAGLDIPMEEALSPEELAARTLMTEEVTLLLDVWAEAWSAQDVELFLSFYSRSFATPGGMSIDDWISFQAQQLDAARWIEVEVTEVRVQVVDERRAIARFVQHYRSDAADVTDERLMELERADTGWLIVREVDIR